jgi:hypothetical protein
VPSKDLSPDHPVIVLTPAVRPSPLRAWMSLDATRATPHIDFGSRWIDPARPQYQRVSWIPTTGELYVTDPEETYVRVLAIVPDRTQLDTMLAGWGAAGAGPVSRLSWIEDRVDREVGPDATASGPPDS